MSATFAYRLTWGLYHLALGTWFGAMVMLVVAAGITFVTVKGYEPTLGAEPYRDLTEIEKEPKYPLAVRVLAGGVVGNVLKGLAVIQVICALVVVLCLALQWTVFAEGMSVLANVVRTVLILVPIVVLAVDVAVITPRAWRQRSVMYDPAQMEAARIEAHGQFQRYHKLNERLVGLAALSLGAAIVVSAWAIPLARTVGGNDGG